MQVKGTQVNSAVFNIGSKFVVIEAGKKTPFGGNAVEIFVGDTAVTITTGSASNPEDTITIPLALMVAASYAGSMHSFATKLSSQQYGVGGEYAG